jgi:hypothetical protein
VYLSTQLQDKLALFQYPHRPPNPDPHPLLPPSLRRPPAKIDARIKPKVSQVELSVPLEVDEGVRQSRFSLEKAKEHGRGVKADDLASSAESGNKVKGGRGRGRDLRDGSRGEEERILSKMTLQGDLVPDQTNYCVALLKDGQYR